MLLSRNNKDMLPLVLTLTLSVGELVGGQGVHHEEHYEPSPYGYEYKVHDDKVYLDFGAEEEGDGKDNVHGFYHVQLPDGRLQKVTYTVNSDSGYIADVTYDGEAVHPAYHAGGGPDDGHLFGNSLALETFQIRPQTTVTRDRIGKSLDVTKERPNFSGFIGSSSRRSNSVPSGIESFQRSPATTIESERSGKSFLHKAFHRNPTATVESGISGVSLGQEPFQKSHLTAAKNNRFGKSLTQESFQRTSTGTVQNDKAEPLLPQEPFQKRPSISEEIDRSGKSIFHEVFQKSPTTVVESDRFGVSLDQEPFQKKPTTAVENNRSGKSFDQESFQTRPTETAGSDVSSISLTQEPFQKISQTAAENDRSGKSLVQEPFQKSPKTTVESDKLENSIDGKQEKHIFLGGLLGSPSQRSNSLPTNIEEAFIPEQKEVSKRDDEDKVSEPKSSSANNVENFQPKQTSFTNKGKQEESVMSSVSPLEEFLKTFKPRSSSFIKLRNRKNKAKKFLSKTKSGKKKLLSFEAEPSSYIFESSSQTSDPRKTSSLSPSSRKTIDEFLKIFEPKSPKFTHLKNKAQKVSSESTFGGFQNSAPASDSSSHSSSHPEPDSRSPKNLKTTTKKIHNSSLIVHRRLPTQ